MNNSQLDRVLRLIRRTGDRCLIFDRENDQGVAVVGLDEYERMLNNGDINDLSETDMLNKINRDIALWRQKHESDWDGDSDSWEQGQPENNWEEAVEPEPVAVPENVEKPLDLAKNEPSADIELSEGEEPLSNIPDDGEEEKFYIEPVE